jgi:tripartite-type tricarboxylate transporter receptor subunit TctC
MKPILLLLIALLAQAAHAQRYPWQAVRVIAPAPPGSPVDIRARWAAEQLAAALGQPVVVENKPGAGGNLGAQAGARSAADGHTLLLVHQGILAFNPHLYERTGFDALNDFTGVTRLIDGTLMLMVPQASPLQSVEGLIQRARERPGQLSYGSSGVGTPPHLAAELFRRTVSIDIVHVPYKGATPSLVDLLAARVDFSIDSPSSHGPHVKAGKLRALAVTSRQRLAAFADVPTMAEAGLPSYEYQSWIGVVAPAATPREIIRRLNAELVRAIRSPAAQELFASQGAVPVGDTPEEFDAFIRAEHEKWGRLIRESGIRAD